MAQVTRLLLVSVHRTVLVPVPGCKPDKIMVELASRVKVTSLVPDGAKVVALLAFKTPAMVTVSRAEAILTVSAVVLSVAMLIVLPAVPVPMLMVLALLLTPRLIVPVVPESRVSAPVVPEVRERALPAADVIEPVPAKPRDVAEVEIVSMEATPVSAPAVETFKPLEVKAKVPVELPMATLPVEVLAILTLAAPAVARSVLPVEERVVKAAVEAVVAPMAVLLMPVEVVLKLLAVMVRSLAPVLIEEAPKPESVSAPEVAVKFKAPVVWVRPLEAVNKPAEVIVPDPVVVILPEVETTPFSLMVNFGVPSD